MPMDKGTANTTVPSGAGDAPPEIGARIKYRTELGVDFKRHAARSIIVSATTTKRARQKPDFMAGSWIVFFRLIKNLGCVREIPQAPRWRGWRGQALPGSASSRTESQSLDRVARKRSGFLSVDQPTFFAHRPKSCSHHRQADLHDHQFV